MKKTVYLNKNEKNTYITVDGPSLLIKSHQTADKRIPIKMISRVVIFGNISIESDVLTFLAQHNILVLFISSWARQQSILMPFNYGLPSLCMRLELIAKDETKKEEFKQWAREMRVFLERYIISKLSHSRPNIYGDDYRKVIYFFMPEDKEKWVIVKKILKALFWSLILEEIVNNNLDPHCGIINHRCTFGLVKDYAYILKPEIDLQALQFFKSDSIDILIEGANKSCLLTARGIYNIVNNFENKQYTAKKLIANISNKLSELMS